MPDMSDSTSVTIPEVRTKLAAILSFADGSHILHIPPEGGEPTPVIDQVMEVVEPYIRDLNRATELSLNHANRENVNAERITELEQRITNFRQALADIAGRADDLYYLGDETLNRVARTAQQAAVQDLEYAEDRLAKLQQHVITAMVAFGLPIDLSMSDEEHLAGLGQMVAKYTQIQRAQMAAESRSQTSEGDRPGEPSEAAREHLKAVWEHLRDQHGVDEEVLTEVRIQGDEIQAHHLLHRDSSTECDHYEVDLSGYLDIKGFSSSQAGLGHLRGGDSTDDLETEDEKPNEIRSLDIGEARQHAIKVLEDQEAKRAAIDAETFRRERVGEVVEDGMGSTWHRCGPGCDLDVVRPGKVQCNESAYHCSELPPYDGSADRAGEELSTPSLDAALKWAIKEHSPAGRFPDTRYCQGCMENWPCEVEVLRRGVEVLRVHYLERISGSKDIPDEEDLYCHCGEQAVIVGLGTGVLWCNDCKMGRGCPTCR